MKTLFSPSMMCMDMMKLKSQIEILNDKVDMYHVDIMDGHFVPNITLSPDFVAAVKPVTTKPLDCHLMVTNPDQYIMPLVKAGAGYICPHAETINSDAFRILKKITDNGCKCGVAINPSTSLDVIKYYIDILDKITIMTVDPGFAGQPFVEQMLSKISDLKEYKTKNNSKFIIEIDGSCNKNTFKKLINAGAECLIVGSSGLFNLNEDLNVAWDNMMIDYNEAVK